ncbi:carboxypeptidase regulatory-like domain-containing protein [Methanococcoides sp. NM1]|uniref:carboxypeptidase regulatory-like domain-containing protein n=1 Tax=Methanococcoides sp. NM1 TaxID=1201013 RepID=UPI001083D50A|nr:carboxypeptidase regulatory-like domain-containing protein [Methanococcoides sp. NM1]
MRHKNIIQDEKAAIGLPIRMVVLTIIGMIGFAVIVSAIVNAPTAPRPMYATSNVTSITLSGENTNSGPIEIIVSNFDGEAIGGCNVVLRDPSGTVASGGLTDSSGQILMQLMNISLPTGKREGYITIKTMADGYLEHNDEHFVKVIRG